MIWALVVERHADSSRASKERGRFGFEQLPAAADHIEIPRGDDEIDLMQVAYVQYTPVVDNSGATQSQRHVIVCDPIGSYPRV